MHELPVPEPAKQGETQPPTMPGCTGLPHRTCQAVAPDQTLLGVASCPPTTSDISPALLLQRQNILFSMGRDMQTLLTDWFFLFFLMKVNPWAAGLGHFQVLQSGISTERADNANGSSKGFFMTLVTFLFWTDSSFYLFTPFGYHIFISLSEPLMLLPGDNRHEQFFHLDL